MTTFGLAFTITEDMVPSNFPIQLTTDGIYDYMPQLKDLYGSWPLEVELAATKIYGSTTHSEDSTVSVSLDGDINIFVMVNQTKVHALTFTLEPVNALGTILISDMNLSGNVSDFTIGYLNISFSTIGYPDVGQFNQIVDYGLTLGIPAFNKWCKDKTFAIPSELFGLFQLSDLNLVIKDSFVEAGLTPKFLPFPAQHYDLINYNETPMEYEINQEVFEHYFGSNKDIDMLYQF